MTDDEAEPTDVPRSSGEETFFQDGSFNDWIGLEVDSFGDGEAAIAVDCEDFKLNPGGVMHGGVTATLVDVAGGMAIASTFEDADQMMATTNLDVNYLRPITERAHATAEVVRVGSANAVAQVEVESTAPDGERKRVAVATVTYQLH